MPSDIKDKSGEPIKEGDHVFARSRGGRHEGEVDKIVTSKEEAEKEGVKHPPKVCTAPPESSLRNIKLVKCGIDY